MQSVKDRPFCFLMTYKDDGIKFNDNAALTSKRPAAIAQALLDVWSVIGPPAILGCDNGGEFSNLGKNMKRVTSVNISDEVLPDTLTYYILHTTYYLLPTTYYLLPQLMGEIITELKGLWPELVIVHGKPRHSQTQGGIERHNRTLVEKLGNWMKANKSTAWATVGR